jgi:hypothetical protein
MRGCDGDYLATGAYVVPGAGAIAGGAHGEQAGWHVLHLLSHVLHEL